MKTAPFDQYSKQTKPVSKTTVKKTPKYDETIKGVLLNNYIKKQDSFEKFDNFDRISSQLLIPDKMEKPEQIKPNQNKESFDFKKALLPVFLASGACLGGIALVGSCVNKYSNVMANKCDIVRPGDLARNINILEEPHFAAYRMLRDPNAKNIAGFVGVGIMSVATLVAKTFVDATKEIWVKKQNCDIEHDLQEKLIQVETQAFSGKLNVINTLLSDTTKYFKEVLSKEEKALPNFKSYLTFKGAQEEKNKNETKKENANLKTIAMLAMGVGGFVGLSYTLMKNYHKTLKNLDTFVQKTQHNEICSRLTNAVNIPDKKEAIKACGDVFKIMNATEQTMNNYLSKIHNITPDEINDAILDVKKSQIYAQAPEALGGISEKIQYYCYINEERGHLYNWILNPENKFNKYLFLSFCAISSAGYVCEQVASAIKEVMVNRENSKSELALKKRLVDVEISNFKAKKMSALNPLIDNFIYQLEHKKSKDELKDLAENILIEIKNGPPYVYS